MTNKTNKTNRATAIQSAQPIPANDPHVVAAREAREATSKASQTLVACVLLSATGGRFQPEHLTMAGYAESSAKTLASVFNVGATAADAIGEKAAVDLINATASANATRAYEAVVEACRAVKAEKAERVPEGKPTARQVAAIVKAVPKRIEAKRDAAKNGKSAPRGAQPGDLAGAAGNVAASKSWQEGALALRLISTTMHKAAVPEGMDAQARAFLTALEDAMEAAQPFLRKVVKA